MAFSVSNFSAAINKRGVAVNNLFVLRVTPPSGLQSSMSANELQYFLRGVALPSNQFDIQATKRQGYGPNTAYPSAMEYDQLNCELVVDHAMHSYNFFRKWQQLIYNYNLDKGVFGSNGNQGVYEFAYKKEYESTLEIDVYTSHSTQFKQTFKFYKVWPMTIGNINLGWAINGEVMVAPLTFKYTGFTDSGLIPNTIEETNIDANEQLDTGVRNYQP